MLSPALIILFTLPPPLVDALQRAAPEGTLVEVDGFSAPCAGTRYEPQAFEVSGRVAVRIVGKSCAAWGWATIRVLATQAIVARDVEAGTPLEGAVRLEQREWRRGMTPSPALQGAVAARRLRAGTPLRDLDVRFGPPPGTPITVRIVSNAITVEQRGTIVPCGQQVCATLPSGKRIIGAIRDGVLVSALENGT